jgi:hypothetical protein
MEILSLDKASEIANGWYNVIVNQKHPAIVAMTKHRFSKCIECPFRKGVFGIGDVCSKCTCPLKSKLASYQSECPIGKWGKIEVKEKNNKIELFEYNTLIKTIG